MSRAMLLKSGARSPTQFSLMPEFHYERDDAAERQVALMLTAFRNFGGLVSGDGLAGLLNGYVGQPISTVGRWIVHRTIVNFNWRSETLAPLFQFDRKTMRLMPGTNAVIRELVDAFDDEEIALWFSRSNSWLAGVAPMSLVLSNPTAVLQAAQADRFVARG